MTVAPLQRGLSQAYHENSLVWAPQVETVNSLAADGNKKRITSWHRGTVNSITKRSNGDSILVVQTEDGVVIEAAASECCLQNERDDTVDDLVRSDFLHEPGILHTLRVRYGMDSIYTYSGQILIATNPHKRLRHLYGQRMMQQYRGVPLGELSPHVYAIAEAAYEAMMTEEKRQAILISGESGAGKTESAKMVMQYLAHRAGPVSGGGKLLSMGSGIPPLNGNAQLSAPIEEQVLESNPLLEAFGNAKTARNDNSSRFGKFAEIDFDAMGRVTGASISTYLLERSRVVSIRSPERSFHIFYQLCAGANSELRKDLRLEGGATGFRVLAQSVTFELDDVDDAEAFEQTLEAMRVVGMSDETISSILRCVAAILHLGNVEFKPSNTDEAVVSGPVAAAALETAADLFGVEPQALLMALTTRTIETRGERIVKTLDTYAAAESREALSKTLYSRLFDWLVAAVNRKIGAVGGGGRTSRSIGILDIYGFECFETNSFEQLCINLANEKLQQAFNAHVFKGEQQEYNDEGIAWSYVEFVDNQDVLDLLEGAVNKPQGVFPLIDEACRLPRATHKDLAHDLRTRLKAHPRFGIPRRDQHAFAVDHYAGEVSYSTEALLDKNRDFVIAEHAGLMAKSSSLLLQELFNPDRTVEGGGVGDGGDGSQNKRRSAFMLSSVGARFRRQLAGLMGTLGECQPHFIRCIKPNASSDPGQFTSPYVLEQLRAGGVLEAVRIACAGFPTRRPFLPFAQRFARLLPPARLEDLNLPMAETGFVDWYSTSETQVAEVVKRVLKQSGVEGWQMGRTRVFLRSGQLAQLEGERGRLLSAAAIKVQAAWRGKEARMRLQRSLAAIVCIQRAWRRYVYIKNDAQRRQELNAVQIQAAWKRYTARKAFLDHRRNTKAIIIQANWRRHMARTKYLKETEAGRRAAAKAAAQARQTAAVITIQANWRRVLAQREAAVLRRQALRMKELQQERDALAAERAALAAALAEAETRATRAEADAKAKAARISTLESQVAEVHAKVESVKAEVALASAAGATAAQAAAAQRAAELEAAHQRAATALREEGEVAKRQRAEADERTAAAEQKLRLVQADLDAARAQQAQQAAAAEELKFELEASKIQVATANRELVTARSLAEAAAAVAAAEAAALSRKAEERIAAAKAESSASHAATFKVDTLTTQLIAAEAKAKRNATAVKDAQDKSSQLAARVEALHSRVERLEAEAREAAAREAALIQELDTTRRAAAAAAAAATVSRVRGPSPLSRSSLLQSPMSTPVRRAIAHELDAAASGLESASPSRSDTVEAADLVPGHSELVIALTEAVVFQKLPCVDAWSGPGGILVVHQAAWLLHKCLLQWAREWRPTEVAAAAQHIETSIANKAVADGTLASAGYWLAASLATGALLKVRVVGKPDLQFLFKLADAFIGLTDLHIALGGVIAEEIPVDVALLLSEDAKRSARRRSVGRAALAPVANGTPKGGTPPCPPNVGSPASPADVELSHMGAAERHWRAILGGIANIVEVLREQGVPAAAVRAVVWATLRYIDGELLNALLLRRDCCSVSAAKALLTGLAALKDVSSFVGHDWGCEPEEAERALQRSNQAAKYLVQGKDDCARKAQRAVNVLPDLTRQCAALTLQQVHRLTEHQHDDWLAASGTAMGSQTLMLLEALRRLMNENRKRLGGPSNIGSSPSPSPGLFMPGALEPASSSRWVSFGEEESSAQSQELEVDEEDLLVDPSAAFAMFKVQHTVTRKLLTEAAKSFVAPGAAAMMPSNTPAKDNGSPGPRLPNGSVPRGSMYTSAPTFAGTPEPPQTPTHSSMSMLTAIDESCRHAGIPEALLSNQGFAFLK